MSVNRVIMIGRVGKDTEVINSNGRLIGKLTLALSESWKSKDGERKTKTEWVNIVAFSNEDRPGVVSVMEKYVKKGSKIYIEGKYETTKYKNKEGNDVYSTQVNINRIELLDPKEKSTEEPVQEKLFGQPVPPVNDDIPI